MVVLGLGYRPVEYELHGVDFDARGRIADEKLAACSTLLRGAVRDGAQPARHPATVLAGRAAPRVGWAQQGRGPQSRAQRPRLLRPDRRRRSRRPPTSRPPATPGTSPACASSHRRTPPLIGLRQRRRSTPGGRRSATRCSRTRCRTTSGTRRRAAPTARPACRRAQHRRGPAEGRGLPPGRHRGRGDRPRPHARHAVAAAPLRWPRPRGGLAVPPSGRRRRGPGDRRGWLTDGGPNLGLSRGAGSRAHGRCPA